MISILFGKDEFTVHEALAALEKELNEDGMLADNTTRVEGANARPEELLAFCQTMPFLGAHRLVVVRGLLGRFESAARGRRRKTKEPVLGAWEPFVESLSTLPESTTLVFIDGEIRAQNPLLKALRPLAQVHEYKRLAQGEVASWITRRAQQHGALLEARAVAALAQLVGNQLWTLDSELRKLATYADGRKITVDDVRLMVSLAREPSVFAMADAVVEGRTREAAGMMQRLLAEGESPQRLLTTIARQYRLLLLTKELLEQRVRAPEMATRLQVQGFVVQRLLKQAPRYTIQSLRQAYRFLLEADLSVKRGVHDGETALQLLIFDLAALGAQGGARTASPRDGRPGYSRRPAGRGSSPRAAATP